MPLITLELTQKEHEAISEYANQCGETIANLARKALVREITLADGYGADDPQYEYNMIINNKQSRTQEYKVIQENYNKIRRILGWTEVKL